MGLAVIEVRKDSVLTEFMNGCLLRISRDIIDGDVQVNDILVVSNGRFAADTQARKTVQNENYRLAQTMKEQSTD